MTAAEYRDFIKQTTANNQFNIRFYLDGRVLEWPRDGDISEAWEGEFYSGPVKAFVPSLTVRIGDTITEYEEEDGYLRGLEKRNGEDAGASQIFSTSSPTSLFWFQGKGVH
jgi:hypothetical protein